MLTVAIKNKLAQMLAGQSDLWGPDGLLNFLTKVWPLREMPSEDTRFKDAYSDIRQHMVNNNDWSIETLLVERLNLLNGPDNIYIKFIETAADPEIRKTTFSQEFYVQLINDQLQHVGLALRVASFFEGKPVYQVMSNAAADQSSPVIPVNNIPFFKGDQENISYPCFILSGDRWNDYGYITRMTLRYYTMATQWITIGIVRIMKSDVLDTWNEMPDTFNSLPLDYCSLGSTESYYSILQNTVPNYMSVLLALRDAAIFPIISEQFDKSEGFKRSLLRPKEAENIWRFMRFNLSGRSISEGMKFSYKFHPPYAEQAIYLDFDFEYNKEIDHRVYALIGKNGTGKTKILSGIAMELSKDDTVLIGPKKPLFAKIFSISYSYFDSFPIPQGNATFNYVYCGLKKNKETMLNKEELFDRFRASTEKIKYKSLINDWRNILSHFISNDILLMIFTIQPDGGYRFKLETFAQTRELLSSGQHILLYVLTELLAQIRENSLILFDEPEMHLHPNAIAELMNSLLRLVKQFHSFCIIATHSPMVIQNIQSRDIYVIVRQENEVSSRKLELESFGENLTVITEDIFGTREVPKDHLELLNELKLKGHSYEEIIAIFQTENGLGMNLNTRLFLKSLF